MGNILVEESAPVKEINHHSIFDSQKERFIKTRGIPLKDRVKKLKAIRSWVLKNRNNIKSAIYEDFRKPPGEVDLSEIRTILSEIRHVLSNLNHWARVQKIDTPIAFLGTKAEVRHEPKGVCLIISPWNFPFNLSVGPLVSAIAAGNFVILKPSEATPNTSNLIRSMVEVLFEPSEIAVLEGGVEVSQKLLELPFDHIFFTGSPRVGKIVMEAASKNLSSVTLELGGKSPTIIDEGANLQDAAEKICWGKFMNNGQTCIAPDYVFVHESQQKEFVDHLIKYIRKQFGGPESDFHKSKDYARLVSLKHFKQISNLIDTSETMGAKIEFGNEKDELSNFISPTILTNVSLDSPLMQEEIFGPVLPVLNYNALDEVIEYINSQHKPLALYLFSNSKSIAAKVLDHTTSGTFCLNDCVLQFSHPNLPFGGINNSGIGKSHGKWGFEAFSNLKPVLKQRVGITGLKTLYPPYNKINKLIDFVTKHL